MSHKIKIKKKGMLRRKKSIKGKLSIGRYPRLVVYRSNSHLYAQLIDDNDSKTLLSISTNDSSFKKEIEKLDSKISKSTFVGRKMGEEIVKQKIKKVMFDRNGYIYHGRVKAFADAVRESGLNI